MRVPSQRALTESSSGGSVSAIASVRRPSSTSPRRTVARSPPPGARSVSACGRVATVGARPSTRPTRTRTRTRTRTAFFPSPEVEVGSIKVRARATEAGVSRAGPSADERTAAVVLPLHQRLRLIKARRGGCDTAEARRRPWRIRQGRRGKRVAVGRRRDPRDEAGRRRRPRRSPRPLPLHRRSDEENPTTSIVSDKETVEADDARRRFATLRRNASSDRRDPAAGFGVTCGVLSTDETENRVLAVALGVGFRESAYAPSRTRPRRRRCTPRTDWPGRFCQRVQRYDDRCRPDGLWEDAHDVRGVSGGRARGGSEGMRGGVRGGGGARSLLASSRPSLLCAEARERDFDLLRKELAAISQCRARPRFDGRAERPVTCMVDVLDALAEGDAQNVARRFAMNDRSPGALGVHAQHGQRDVDGVARWRQTLPRGPRRSRNSPVARARRRCRRDGSLERVLLLQASHGGAHQRGLLALKRCRRAARSQAPGEREPNRCVPYHDSKLTTLLSSALRGREDGGVGDRGGSTNTHRRRSRALRRTVRFGGDERKGLGQPVGGDDRRLNAKIAACEVRIKEVERWETTKTTRRDEIEEGTRWC